VGAATIGTLDGSTTAGACAKHVDTRAVGTCRDCGGTWCTECLVPPSSRRQPLRCVECALVAAGIRPRSHRPVDGSGARP